MVQQIADHVLAEIRHDLAIGDRSRAQQERVDGEVGREDLPVQSLERVVFLRDRLAVAPVAAIDGRAPARTAGQRRREQRATHDRKGTRLNSSPYCPPRLPSSASNK